MDGQEKFTLIVVCIAVVCVTILYCFLFLLLRAYRQYVVLSLLTVIIAGVAVFLRGRLTEQSLRVTRYRHQEATLLDEYGQPMYWHDGYQPNPHRR